jgi:hypothetical protein
MTWPPSLAELKLDMKIADSDTRDDDRLQQVLDASVAFVERVHDGAFNFAGELVTELPEVPADLQLGTLRLAGRWHVRRRSPDALIQAGELGTSRVPTFDPDIERLLRIGRHRKSVIA